MNVALVYLLACALAGLFYLSDRRWAYVTSMTGAVLVAGIYYAFWGLM